MEGIRRICVIGRIWARVHARRHATLFQQLQIAAFALRHSSGFLHIL
jgi:hypothetical protein